MHVHVCFKYNIYIYICILTKRSPTNGLLVYPFFQGVLKKGVSLITGKLTCSNGTLHPFFERERPRRQGGEGSLLRERTVAIAKPNQLCGQKATCFHHFGGLVGSHLRYCEWKNMQSKCPGRAKPNGATVSAGPLC